MGRRVSLVQNDPALYLILHEGITLFHLRGGSALSLEKIEALAAT